MAVRKPLQLETFLPYRLSLLSNTVSGAIAATYQDKFGISMPEWRIMMILAEYPGSSADEVCRRTRIEKSVVSRAVTRLMERHLVTRDIDTEDRRRSVLELSATGESVYAEVMPVATRHEQALLEELSGTERRQLARLLEKLLRSAEGLAAPGK